MLIGAKLRARIVGAVMAVLPATISCTQKATVSITAPANLPIQKQENIRNLVAELNEYVPQHPVTKVKTDPCHGHYDPEKNEITVPVKTDDYLDVVAHEMGHVIYESRVKGTLFEDFWGQLYNASLGWKNYQFLKDDSYISQASLSTIHNQCNMQWGHGLDNAGELFASGLAIYRRHPDEYLARLTPPNLREENRQFGKLIFQFMRDHVFDGRYFSYSDPFAGERFFSFVGRRLDRLEIDALGNVCQDDQLPIRKYGIDTYALVAIFRSRVRDNRFDLALNNYFDHCLKNRAAIFEFALDAESHRADMVPVRRKERLIPLIIKGLGDEQARFRAMQVIIALKMRSPEFIGPLVKILEEDKIEGRVVTAIDVLAEIGNKSILAHLEKIKDYPGETGQAARKAINSILARPE